MTTARFQFLRMFIFQTRLLFFSRGSLMLFNVHSRQIASSKIPHLKDHQHCHSFFFLFVDTILFSCQKRMVIFFVKVKSLESQFRRDFCYKKVTGNGDVIEDKESNDVVVFFTGYRQASPSP